MFLMWSIFGCPSAYDLRLHLVFARQCVDDEFNVDTGQLANKDYVGDGLA